MPENNIVLLSLIIISFLLVSTALSRVHFFHSSVNKSGFLFIEGLRGIAALLVICAHSWRFEWLSINSKVTLISQYHNEIGFVGVSIFFCITGFLFSQKLTIKKKGNWPLFYKKRFLRLFPLYFLMCFLTISIAAANTTQINKEFIIQSARILLFGFAGTRYIVDGFDGTIFTGVVWTLVVEWVFYMSMPLISILINLKTYMVSFLFLSFAILVILIGVKHGVVEFIGLSFLVGISIGITQPNHIQIKTPLLKDFLFILMVSFFIFIIKTNKDHGMIMNKFRISYIVGSFLFSYVYFIRPNIIKMRALLFTGAISYSLYLLHSILYYLFAYTFNKAPPIKTPIGIDGMAVICLSFSLITVLICSLTFKYIEKTFMKEPATKMKTNRKISQ